MGGRVLPYDYKNDTFVALYDYAAPNFLDLLLSDSQVPRVGDLLYESKDIVATLRDNIARAQTQQK